MTSLAPFARTGFLIAATGTGLMALLMLTTADGASAVLTIAGLDSQPVSPETLRLAIGCDTLLPIGYTTGFCLLALSRTADHILAPIVCLFTAGGAVMDFLENGAALMGDPILGLTVAKFGCLGIAAFLLAPLVHASNPLDRIAALVLQAIPLFMALTLADLLVGPTEWAFVLSLLGSFLLAAVVSRDVPSSQGSHP